MKNILVPTDFSDAAHNAYQVALQLARQAGGSIALLHAIDEPHTAAFSTFGGPVNGSELPNSNGPDDLFMRKLLEATKGRMHRLIAEADGVPVQDMVAMNSPANAMLDTAEQQHSDLIVIGAQDHSALDRFFASTNTETLIRKATCPVLVVRHAHPDFKVKNIAFASDFSNEVEGTVPQLQQVLTWFPGAQLHLLHVSHDPADGALARVQDFASRHGLAAAVPAVFIDSEVSGGIQRFAQQHHIDLVIIPTHGRTGLRSYFQSSIAENVAKHTVPPVLTFHL